ncbi:ATP-binding protein [Streptomyces sp. NBC_00304]|uniref:ATP-binding protein n=1 Tax=Streptomyces sp. NBC_00304 TaxID=2975706 RepID=UPI002E293E7A|nr:ATP-binding protein [Streptomyces sp. NBC_00304]
MLALTLVLALLAVAGSVLAVRFRRAARRAEQRAGQLHEHAERLTQQMQMTEHFVRHLATTAVPAPAGGAGAGPAGGIGVTVPPQLAGSPVAEAVGALAGQFSFAVKVAGRTAEEQVALARREADEQVAHARKEAVDVARAAVRSFAAGTVHRASKLGTKVSAGVRQHVSDDAYETLVEIDHLAQQMLLTASGYAVLAGDKLSRRHPVTALGEIVRSAMGRVEGFQRVQHADVNTFGVEGRAVEAVIHTLAILLDNALRYSAPNTRVHVSLEHGNDAVFLIVDDAGLRMEDERLEWARRVMSSEERDDITKLGAYPQTGLRVAGALAASYGYRVEVTAPNVYGGTRAFIVLPQKLLTTPPAPQPAVPATPPASRRRQAPAPVAAPAPPAPPAAPAALVRPETAEAPVPAPAAAPGQAAEPERAEPSTTVSGLTVRRRSAPPSRRHAATAVPVEPGRPEVATAWLNGARSVRDTPSTPPETEGR